MTSIPIHTFECLLTRCALLPAVRAEVVKNHDNNLWWPLSVSDWRLRMLMAGLSTRVSYAMVTSYRTVMDSLNAIGYEALLSHRDDELAAILRPIGLTKARLRFYRSLTRFIASLPSDAVFSGALSNDDLIQRIADNVDGSGYKVAQCCVLYARGYHCGVIPVDSGMRDKLSLCLGMTVAKTAKGHDSMRKQLEGLVARIDSRAIASNTGYDGLKFPATGSLTWWAHLVLIYYKRLHCNRLTGKPCPIRSPEVAQLAGPCALHSPH